MNKEGVILIAEDDEGHFELIKRSLQRAGVCNEILRFADGQETLDFLFVKGDGPTREHDKEYQDFAEAVRKVGLLLSVVEVPQIDGMPKASRKQKV